MFNREIEIVLANKGTPVEEYLATKQRCRAYLAMVKKIKNTFSEDSYVFDVNCEQNRF